MLLGVCVGLGYAWAMADRLGIGLLAFLRTGLGSPWAELADERRLDAILRLDLLGGGLHLPLVFVLAYGILRSIGAGHRAAGPWAFAAGLVAAVVGPIASRVSPVGSFLAVAWLVAYGVTLAAFAFAPADLAPTGGRPGLTDIPTGRLVRLLCRDGRDTAGGQSRSPRGPGQYHRDA